MKFSQVFFFAISGLLVSGVPLEPRFTFSGSDTWNDMNDAVHGKPCNDVAVIFARGTGDLGNIGSWVGPQFFSAVKAGVTKAKKTVALQGVDRTAYPADLKGFFQGGPDSAAKSLAKVVIAYHKKCPKASFILSGWSQGALVAHKGLALLSPAALARTRAIVTFGDPHHLFSTQPIPSSVKAISYCISGLVFDPLCAKLPADFASSAYATFNTLPTVAKGLDELKSAAALLATFPKQLLASRKEFMETIKSGKIVRLMLTPQHFIYGNNGMAAAAGQAAAAAVIAN